MKRGTCIGAALLGAALFLSAVAAAPARAQQPKKDYLSDEEADKIREAYYPAVKIKLFVSFAADRIKKLQYEMAHPEDSLHRADVLNSIINGYTGCIDDATDLIDIGVDKSENIRDGIKAMQSQAPDFLAYLKQLEASGPELDSYKDNLDDAVDATNDAINEANDADKQLAPPPERRKPQ